MAVAIEDVPLGSRVATCNPVRSDYDESLPEPDESWKLVRLEFRRKNGSRVDIELLRPVEWIDRHRLEAGCDIFMSNAEIEVRGTGRVLAIEDCPPIADGEGSVVIARIKTHHAGHLIELQFENGETLTGTASHPIWSADRQDWVPLGELHEGEYTQSRDGLLKITRRIALPDMQPVYNLEVHGEHVYEVTRAGVLVHNNVPDCLRFDALRKKLAETGKLGHEELEEFGKLYDQFKTKKVAPIRLSENWRPVDIGNPRYASNCDAIANQIKKHIGGEVVRIEPRGSRRFLPSYRGHAGGWGWHDVVVKAGRVYDAFTGKDGLPINEYKALWESGSSEVEWGF